MGLCLGQRFVTILLHYRRKAKICWSWMKDCVQTCCTVCSSVWSWAWWLRTSRVMDAGSPKTATMWQLCVNGWPSFCAAGPRRSRRGVVSWPVPVPAAQSPAQLRPGTLPGPVQVSVNTTLWPATNKMSPLANDLATWRHTKTLSGDSQRWVHIRPSNRPTAHPRSCGISASLFRSECNCYVRQM